MTFNYYTYLTVFRCLLYSAHASRIFNYQLVLSRLVSPFPSHIELWRTDVTMNGIFFFRNPNKTYFPKNPLHSLRCPTDFFASAALEQIRVCDFIHMSGWLWLPTSAVLGPHNIFFFVFLCCWQLRRRLKCFELHLRSHTFCVCHASNYFRATNKK